MATSSQFDRFGIQRFYEFAAILNQHHSIVRAAGRSFCLENLLNLLRQSDEWLEEELHACVEQLRAICIARAEHRQAMAARVHTRQALTPRLHSANNVLSKSVGLVTQMQPVAVKFQPRSYRKAS